jgi:DNA-binding XRE family transcriptional regulator
MKIRLAALRVNAKLSQDYVANALHVSKSTVGKWENYKTSPTAIQLHQLCDLYHCTLNDVFIPSKLSKESKK